MLGSSLVANFLLVMNGPHRIITCFRGSPKVTTGSYPFFAQSLIAPLLPVAIHSSYEVRKKNLQIICSATFAPTQQKKKQTHTYTYMYMYMHMYMYVYMYLYVYEYVHEFVYVYVYVYIYTHEKTQSGTRTFHDMYCSKHLTFYNGCIFLSTTNNARKNCISKQNSNSVRVKNCNRSTALKIIRPR